MASRARSDVPLLSGLYHQTLQTHTFSGLDLLSFCKIKQSSRKQSCVDDLQDVSSVGLAKTQKEGGGCLWVPMVL